MIDTTAESQHRFLATSNFMENINTTDHGRGIEVRQFIHGPRLTTNFGTNLNEDFIADRAYVFTTRNGVNQHNLGWHGDFF
jgi:hypothetical protein